MEQNLPIRVGQQVEMDISGFGHAGEGVGRVGGMAVFVPLTIPGERIQATITKVQRNFARGRLDRVLVSAGARTIPVCSVFGHCGGCSLQHMNYHTQLDLKTRQVQDALARLGGLANAPVLPIIGMDHPWGYRNKVSLHPALEDGRLCLGYHAGGSQCPVLTRDCGLLPEEMVKLWAHVEAVLNERGIQEELWAPGRGLPDAAGGDAPLGLASVVLRRSVLNGDMMVLLNMAGRLPPPGETTAQQLTAFPGVVSVVRSVPAGRYQRQVEVLAGRGNIMEKLGGMTYRISPLSFFQVNSLQAAVLVEVALGYADLSGTEKVIDLYAGAGTFALHLARRARVVFAVELAEQAVADGQFNARLNNIENIEYLGGDVMETLPALVRRGIRPAVVLLDPPRQGCDQKVIQAVLQLAPQRIVYVSCNPATLARDLKLLAVGSYHPVAVQPVDMFPHTSHVECVTLMSKVEK